MSLASFVKGVAGFVGIAAYIYFFKLRPSMKRYENDSRGLGGLDGKIQTLFDKK